MRDKRPVDELTIEELERVLAIKKRQARQKQLQRMKNSGRVIAAPKTNHEPPAPAVAPPKPQPQTQSAQQPEESTAPAQTDAPAVKTPPPLTGIPHFEDDPDGLSFAADQRRDHDQVWKRFLNFALLLVELGAVAGLVFISFNLIGTIGKLEKETESAQQVADATRRAGIPTLEPTPVLRPEMVVLPGGHTYDPETGQAQINFDEIPDSVPANLLPVIRSRLLRPDVARPPRTPQTALILNIPRLNIDSTIVQGSDWEALQQGVGQVLNGYDPSDPEGNVALSAHDDVYGEIFRHIDELEVGDEFFIQTETEIYTYRVTGFEEVAPDTVEILQSQGRATATLISCYPYQINTHRYVVYADRV